MAGVKGKSGGPRKGSGGARPGAGRKPKDSAEKSANEYMEEQPHGGALKRTESEPVEVPEMNMLELLQEIALGRYDVSDRQLRAAIAAVQYTHAKKGEGGKKDEKAELAKQAGKKFGATPPPGHLRAVK